MKLGHVNITTTQKDLWIFMTENNLIKSGGEVSVNNIYMLEKVHDPIWLEIS